MFDEIEMTMILNATAPPGTIHSLILSGSDSVFGCPIICASPTVYVNLPPNICADIESYITYEEYSSFIKSINRGLYYSHFPICPTGCIPFAIICPALYEQTYRPKNMEYAISVANERLEGRPVKWVLSDVSSMYFAGVAVAYLVLKYHPHTPLTSQPLSSTPSQEESSDLPTAIAPTISAMVAVPINPDYEPNNNYPTYVNMLFETCPPNTVLTLSLVGEEGRSGCPKCCFNGALATHSFVIDKSRMEWWDMSPAERTVITDTAVDDIIADVNSTLLDTLFPVSPCILFHLLLPFSPICCLLHFKNLREWELCELVDRHNGDLAPKGFHWEKSAVPVTLYSEGAPVLHLVKNPSIVTAYLNSIEDSF